MVRVARVRPVNGVRLPPGAGGDQFALRLHIPLHRPHEQPRKVLAPSFVHLVRLRRHVATFVYEACRERKNFRVGAVRAGEVLKKILFGSHPLCSHFALSIEHC